MSELPEGRQRYEAHDLGKRTPPDHGPTVCRVNDDGTCRLVSTCEPSEQGEQTAQEFARLLNERT